jgi:hypothetical protein
MTEEQRIRELEAIHKRMLLQVGELERRIDVMTKENLNLELELANMRVELRKARRETPEA